MLGGIQNTISVLLAKNQNLKQDILELKSALNASRTVTDNLRTQLRKAEKVDTLKEELDSTRNKLNAQIEESNRLDEIYDELEQYTRKNALERMGSRKNFTNLFLVS